MLRRYSVSPSNYSHVAGVLCTTVFLLVCHLWGKTAPAPSCCHRPRAQTAFRRSPDFRGSKRDPRLTAICPHAPEIHERELSVCFVSTRAQISWFVSLRFSHRPKLRFLFSLLCDDLWNCDSKYELRLGPLALWLLLFCMKVLTRVVYYQFMLRHKWLSYRVPVIRRFFPHGRPTLTQRPAADFRRFNPSMHPHLGGFDFVARAARPSCEVRQNLTLLPIQTRVHLTPPLLQDDGCWGRRKKERLRHTNRDKQIETKEKV